MIVRNSPFPTQMQTTQTPQNQQNQEVKDSTNAETSPTNLDEKEQKVSDIKQQVDNGTYKIDINKTADKMAQDLLLDIKVYK